MSPAIDPMDQIVVYLVPGLGVGQRLKVATIDERLRRLPLRQSLMVLSEMCFKVEKASALTAEVDAQIELAEQVFPRTFLPAAIHLLRQERPRVMVLSPQVIVLLGIRLLSVTADDVVDTDADRLRRELGSLSLALGDHVDAGPLTVESTVLEILRLSVFYGRSGHSGWLSLAGRLFFDVLPRLIDHPDWIDPLRRFQAGTGLTLERFWAITSAQATVAAHSPEHFLFPLNIREQPIPVAELDAWRRLLMCTLPEAMSAARIDMGQPLAWSMSSVWKRPIIDLGDGRGLVLRGSLLEMQVEPSQMFWHVGDVLHDQGVPHESWSGLYGKAVEVLGLDLLREFLDAATVLDEGAFVKAWAIPPSSKRADAAIVDSGDVVVVDFVSRQFTRETTTTGDFGALAKDLRLGVTEKLEQVDVTLRYALAAGAGYGRIFPLVVIAGPFPMIPPLDNVVNSGLAKLKMEVINTVPSCRPWMVLDLRAFLMLLRVSTAMEIPLPDLLDQWQSSPLARNEFRDWALFAGMARDLPGGGLPDDGFSRVSRYLGFGTVGLLAGGS